MKRAFVTGWPIKHSKSPILHGHWLDHLQIEGSYEAIAVEPEKFSSFMKELPSSGFKGGNVTIPHKEMAYKLVDELDEAAKAIGAVNTIHIENGKLAGSNTDAYGFAANLDSECPAWRSTDTALVLGAGGASRAIIHALKQSGFSKIIIANRTLQRAEDLAVEFGETCRAVPMGDGMHVDASLLKDIGLVVNTTSLGMNDANSDLALKVEQLPNQAIVTDIVYTPLETPLLKAAKSAGLETVDGLGMLLHQAVPGFELWFDKRPKVTPQLRETVLKTL